MKNLKKTMIVTGAVAAFAAVGFTMVAVGNHSSHKDMVGILQSIRQKNNNVDNSFNPEAKLAYFDSVLAATPNMQDMDFFITKADLLLQGGKEKEAVKLYESIEEKLDFMTTGEIMGDAAIAYMRLGERSNCVLNHTGSSCIFPIQGNGVHIQQTGSAKAIETYKKLLTINPDDLESRWLLNIAYMTLGQYPAQVPNKFLIPNLDVPAAGGVKPFRDVAHSLGLDIRGRAGGVVIDDFNRDGYMDIITSGWDLADPMHYFENDKNGAFTDVTA